MGPLPGYGQPIFRFLIIAGVMALAVVLSQAALATTGAAVSQDPALVTPPPVSYTHLTLPTSDLV